MAKISVFPHGDRWAVSAHGEESPSKEFPTREAAELAARELAGGGEVEVLEQDPTGLGGVAPRDAGQPHDPGPEPARPAEVAEDPRTIQRGL
jgi:hypothetical protein